MSYCAKIPEENQAAALLHYLGISRTRKGYWYIRWILEWGRQEEMDEARFYTRLVRRCKVPRLQMARDMYRALHRVDTLRNYLEGAESVQAGVWALLCVPSRWLNRYEAELPEGVMVKMRSSKARAEVLTPGWEVTEPREICMPHSFRAL